MVNKNIFLIFIITLFPILNAIPANAEDGYLWVPEKMIKGQLNHGMIVLDSPSNSSQLIILGTSNPDVAGVQKSVSITANNNHGIFEITQKSSGDVTISAVYQGIHFTADATVYSDVKKPSMLKIIIPTENIKAEKIQAAVYSLDENGSPVPVNHNTIIKISSSENIKSPRDVIIPFEQDHVFFPVTVNGNGFFSASSQEFESFTIDIQKTLEKVDVNFGIAPQIAHENSMVYFYIQLEKDGKPYRPPYVVDAFLTSSDEGVISFSKEGKINKNRIFSVSLVDGFAKGVAYSKSMGSADLLVNVPSFGFGSADLVVGKAVINAEINQSAQRVIENNSTEIEITRFEKVSEGEPTDLLMWIFPEITDKNAFAVIGAYQIIIEKEIQLELAENQTQETTLYNQYTITPTFLNNEIVTISSSGNVKHENMYEFRQNGIIPGSAIEVPLLAQGDGIHSVFVSATNLGSASSEFEVTQKYNEQYTFQITPLPFSAGTNKDVAMISITDGTKNMVDVRTVTDDYLNLYVSSQNLSTDSEASMYKNTYIVNAQEIYGKDHLTVSSENIPPKTVEITPSGVISSSEILMPSKVHVGERFPFVIYNVDSDNIPLEKDDSFDFSASNEIVIEDKFLRPLIATNNATIAVITDSGISSAVLEIFENKMSFVPEIETHSPRVNNDVLLRIISDVAGIDYTIESPFPYTKINDSSFVVTPDRELNADLTIIGTKDGYSNYSQTISIDAKKIVTVIVKGIDSDGVNLFIPYVITSQGTSEPYDTPFTHNLRSNSVFEFPERHTTLFG